MTIGFWIAKLTLLRNIVGGLDHQQSVQLEFHQRQSRYLTCRATDIRVARLDWC